MEHHQWSNTHNRATTHCVLINSHDWRSMSWELRTGDVVTITSREPTEHDYRAHLGAAGVNPRGLVLPAQMRRGNHE